MLLSPGVTHWPISKIADFDFGIGCSSSLEKSDGVANYFNNKLAPDNQSTAWEDHPNPFSSSKVIYNISRLTNFFKKIPWKSKKSLFWRWAPSLSWGLLCVTKKSYNKLTPDNQTNVCQEHWPQFLRFKLILKLLSFGNLFHFEIRENL